MKLKKNNRIIFNSRTAGDQPATVRLVGRGGHQIGMVLIKADGENQTKWVSIKNCRREKL